MMISTGSAQAGDPAAGRTLARACSACHGLDGLSRRPDAPNIAGQIDIYMIDQLKKYRSGARKHPVMNVVAKGLSDQAIADLTTYYASIKVTVEVPE
jgi:cytochrome c553